jgi:hypothetical protein
MMKSTMSSKCSSVIGHFDGRGGAPELGGPAQEFPPFFSLLKILTLRKKSGGDMARPRTQNLTSPIFDFPPPQR